MDTTEILIEERGIRLARVLLKFNTPIRRYPGFGVWCYLINSRKGIYVFDPGPKYMTGLPLLRLRKFCRLSNNSKLIFDSIDKYFPGKTILQIICSHYHYDHSELGPELQAEVKKRFGNLPPIRLHRKEIDKKRFLRLYRDDLYKVYRQAGYKSYFIGKFAKDNEQLEGTDFHIIHIPGHTQGTIGLISHRYKVIIRGWDKIKSPLARLTYMLINESNKQLKISMDKLDKYPYKKYYFHPEM